MKYSIRGLRVCLNCFCAIVYLSYKCLQILFRSINSTPAFFLHDNARLKYLEGRIYIHTVSILGCFRKQSADNSMVIPPGRGSFHEEPILLLQSDSDVENVSQTTRLTGYIWFNISTTDRLGIRLSRIDLLYFVLSCASGRLAFKY